MHEEMKI